MKNILLKLLFCLALSIPLAIPGQASAQFKIPEILEYQLSWNGIHAGTSELAITPDKNFLKITSVARSAKMISLFYEVRDKVESECKKTSFYPIKYRIKLREGSHRRDKEVIFPQKGSDEKAVYIDYRSKEKGEYKIPQHILDPLSGFYYVRTLPLVVGHSVFLKIFDSKKVWDMEVKVLKKEKVNTWLGTFNTILIKPILKSEGIFLKKGDVYIWLTDDDRRIPVMLESELPVGSVKAIIKAIHY